MKLVSKNWADIPEVFTRAAVMADLELISKGSVELIKEKIYKDSYRKAGKMESRVRDHLNRYYFGKCAYCEMFCKAEIEHYRPKKGVEEDPAHRGYYWLCYEWTNLVPSCRYCNTEGGKGNKFPIAGLRITLPSFTGDKLNSTHCKAADPPLSQEQPLLLHPEIDDPAKHLMFILDQEKKGVRMVARNGSLRGEETIRICNLNLEYKMVDRLQNVIYKYVDMINGIFHMIESGIIDMTQFGAVIKIYFNQVVADSLNQEMTHSLLRSYIMQSHKEFQEIVLPFFTNRVQQDVVLEAFKQYRAGTL